MKRKKKEKLWAVLWVDGLGVQVRCTTKELAVRIASHFRARSRYAKSKIKLVQLVIGTPGQNPLKLEAEKPRDPEREKREHLRQMAQYIDPERSGKYHKKLTALPKAPSRAERGARRVGEIGGHEVVAVPVAKGLVRWAVGGGPSRSPIASGTARTMKDVRREVRKAMRMHKAGDSYGWRDLDERTKGPVWVNAYSVGRSYGGPEEGGWWYDDYTLLESKRVPRHRAGNVKAQFIRKYKDREWGDPSSVRGGERIKVLIEETPGRHTPRPHYE
jgi:hypothetical protein